MEKLKRRVDTGLALLSLILCVQTRSADVQRDFEQFETAYNQLFEWLDKANTLLVTSGSRDDLATLQRLKVRYSIASLKESSIVGSWGWITSLQGLMMEHLCMCAGGATWHAGSRGRGAWRCCRADEAWWTLPQDGGTQTGSTEPTLGRDIWQTQGDITILIIIITPLFWVVQMHFNLLRNKYDSIRDINLVNYMLQSIGRGLQLY